MTKKTLFSMVLVASFMIASAPRAEAASPRPLVTIAPFLQQVQIAPTDGVKNFNVAVTNDSGTTLSFHFSTVDFGSLDETGGLAFAGSNESSLTKKYGLAAWLRLNVSDLSVVPGQTAQVTATIINDVSLQPGGHYAAIIASVKNQGAATRGQVAIKQELSSLVLATKTGGEKYDLHLDSLRYGSNWWHLPSEVTLRFYNPGNVHVVPRGLVKVVAPNGQVVSQGVINDASSFALPQTYRQIPVELQSVGHGGWRPGLYHIQVNYRYDGIDRYVTRTFAARFLNLSSVLLITVVLGVVLWLVFKFRHWKAQKPPLAKGKTSTKIVVKDNGQ